MQSINPRWISLASLENSDYYFGSSSREMEFRSDVMPLATCTSRATPSRRAARGALRAAAWREKCGATRIVLPVNSGCHVRSLQFDKHIADLRASINEVKVDMQQQFRKQQAELELVRAELTKACERFADATIRIEGLEVEGVKESGEMPGFSEPQLRQLRTSMETIALTLQGQVSTFMEKAVAMDRLSPKMNKLQHDVSAPESTSGTTAGVLSAPVFIPRQPFQGSAYSPRCTSAPAYPDTLSLHSGSGDGEFLDRWRRVPPELHHLDDPDLIVDSADEDELDALSEDERCDLLKERFDAVQMLPIEQRFEALQRVVKEQWTLKYHL
jgi:hypothetical protein